MVDAVRAARYVLALTTTRGDVQDGAHPLELRRYEVQNGTSFAGLLG